MNSTTVDRLNRLSASAGAGTAAFTFIELLVILLTAGVLFVILVPAVARTKIPSRTEACVANFQQWALSANLYAADNTESLPSLNSSSAGNIWDVSPGMVPTLTPYGLGVPAWFCPVRASEYQAANRWSIAALGHPISSTTDANAYFTSSGFGFAVLLHNYWVPRVGVGGSIYPATQPAFAGTTANTIGWPRKTSERSAALVPFVSDRATAYASTNVADVSDAHFSNGRLIGVNLGFADGHVTAHSPSQMQAQYTGADGITAFY